MLFKGWFTSLLVFMVLINVCLGSMKELSVDCLCDSTDACD